MKKAVRITSIILILVLALGVFTACSLKPQSKQLIGKWVDSSSLKTGFEFHDDNTVDIVIADIGISINLFGNDIDGTIQGIYSTTKEGDKNILTISYTALLKSVQKTYEYSIKDDILTLIDTEKGEQTVFKRGEVPSADSTAAAS